MEMTKPDDQTTREVCVATLAAFGNAMRKHGETHPLTVRLWREAIQAQADLRSAINGR